MWLSNVWNIDHYCVIGQVNPKVQSGTRHLLGVRKVHSLRCDTDFFRRHWFWCQVQRRNFDSNLDKLTLNTIQKLLLFIHETCLTAVYDELEKEKGLIQSSANAKEQADDIVLAIPLIFLCLFRWETTWN